MMKIKAFLVMLAASLVMMSCEKQPAVADQIQGTYNGKIAMGVGEMGDPADASVQLVANEDGTINIVLPQAGAGQMSMPGFTVANVAVSGEEGAYTIAETAIDQKVADMQFKGSIKGSVKENKLTLSYSVQPGAMPMAINFEFEGTK